jgi:hypothetical protein
MALPDGILAIHYKWGATFTASFTHRTVFRFPIAADLNMNSKTNTTRNPKYISCVT